jgi:putative nucleotidyltransferase with HDIG domain
MQAISPITFRQRIAEIRDLPTLPRIATQVLDILGDPLFSVEALEQVLSQDPSLCAKLLKMANSAYYSLRFPVDSVRRAMLVLGAREIQQMVLSLSVFKVFPVQKGQAAFDRDKFWEHSAASAVIARAFALKLKLLSSRNVQNRPGDADNSLEATFSAGLLHDLGKIALDYYFHDEFMQTLDLVKTENLSMLEAEQKIFGEDHATIGAWLASTWKLPENIVNAIRYHHHPELAEGNRLLVLCTQVGNLFSKVGGTGFGSEEATVGFCTQPSWIILQQLVPEISCVDLDRFTFELEEEFVKARQLLDIMQS